MKPGFTYILECADGSFYTGSTVDLTRRINEHETGLGSNHTRKHCPIKLVYVEQFERIDHAFNREKQIQKWRRDKKLALINGDNNQLVKLAKPYSLYGRSYYKAD